MEKKKLLKNKIVDTLPVLYLETVILMVLGQFLGNFVLGIPVGIAYARNPEILNSAFLNTTLMYVIFWESGPWHCSGSVSENGIVRFYRQSARNHREIAEISAFRFWFWDLH